MPLRSTPGVSVRRQQEQIRAGAPNHGGGFALHEAPPLAIQCDGMNQYCTMVEGPHLIQPKDLASAGSIRRFSQVH